MNKFLAVMKERRDAYRKKIFFLSLSKKIYENVIIISFSWERREKQ